VAGQARPGVLAQRLLTATGETHGVRIHALPHSAQAGATPAHASRGMTHRAVPLLVTADAGVQVPLRLPRVVRGTAGSFGPHRLGGVEAAPIFEIAERAGHRHTRPLVARQAKGLLLVAARAARVVLARGHRVLAQEVVGVNLARAHVAVVAADAEPLLMAGRAEFTVVPRDALVALDEVRAVAGVIQPRRRKQLAARKRRGQKPTRLSQMTSRASP